MSVFLNLYINNLNNIGVGEMTRQGRVLASCSFRGLEFGPSTHFHWFKIDLQF